MAFYFNSIWLIIISLALQITLGLGFHFHFVPLDVSALFGWGLSGLFVGGFSTVITYGFWRAHKGKGGLFFLGAVLFQLGATIHSIFILNATFDLIPRH